MCLATYREGLRDLGVWNPYTELPDRDLYRAFVALASGAIARPVTCALPRMPSCTRSGNCTLSCSTILLSRTAAEPHGGQAEQPCAVHGICSRWQAASAC